MKTLKLEMQTHIVIVNQANSDRVKDEFRSID